MSKPKRIKKVDYERLHRVNKKLGDRGELIVLREERKHLVSLGRKDLADKIDCSRRGSITGVGHLF